MTSRPNFLLFITDQQRADHLACYGNEVLRTPTIDSLAARGVAFDNFYVASPVCQPNRATLVTGRMPSLHGVRLNGISLSVQANTFIELFRAAGWRTALIGKSHLQNFSGQNALVDRPKVPDGYGAAPVGLDEAEKNDRADAIYEQENPKRWANDPRHEIRLPYYGFDHVELCTGHATRVRGSYARWLAERHSDPDALRGPENALPGNTYSLPQAWRTRLPEELYPTTYVADRTIAYLEDHAAQHNSAPFFLQCSFPDPHHPFTPPGRYWDLYKPEDVTLPKSFRIGNRKLPPHVAALHAERDAGTRKAEAQAAFAVTEQEAREAIRSATGSRAADWHPTG